MGREPEALSELLWQRWQVLCRTLGVGDSGSAEGERILTAHREPWRHYHDLRHLVECLGLLDSMDDLGPGDRLAAELALWFHDAVYDPRSDDNEARSAEWSRSWLALIDPALAERVGALVEMTAGHLADPVDAAAVAVADADLSILGTPPPRYGEYARAIRREYAHLSDDDFAAGRIRALEALAARDPLYLRTDTRTVREAQARHNIAAELADLRLSP